MNEAPRVNNDDAASGPVLGGPALGTEAARRLADKGRFPIHDGLTDAEFDELEQRYAFSFADDHRAFLAAGLPFGRGWPDWRNGDVQQLRDRLILPVDGVLFDVEQNGFWYEGWGPLPADPVDALVVARRNLVTAPRLVPVYSHRFLPAGRGSFGHPVLSVAQTDIIHYGTDLVDYLFQEFAIGPGTDRTDPSWRPRATVPFWRDLIS